MALRDTRSIASMSTAPSAISIDSGTTGFVTLVDMLRRRAAQWPERRTFSFLVDGEGREDSLSNRQLDERARAIAALLQERELRGERVLLFYPPGVQLIAAVFGCLYAGAVAILPWPPDPRRLDRTLPRLL